MYNFTKADLDVKIPALQTTLVANITPNKVTMIKESPTTTTHDRLLQLVSELENLKTQVDDTCTTWGTFTAIVGMDTDVIETIGNRIYEILYTMDKMMDDVASADPGARIEAFDAAISRMKRAEMISLDTLMQIMQ